MADLRSSPLADEIGRLPRGFRGIPMQAAQAWGHDLEHEARERRLQARLERHEAELRLERLEERIRQLEELERHLKLDSERLRVQAIRERANSAMAREGARLEVERLAGQHQERLADLKGQVERVTRETRLAREHLLKLAADLGQVGHREPRGRDDAVPAAVLGGGAPPRSIVRAWVEDGSGRLPVKGRPVGVEGRGGAPLGDLTAVLVSEYPPRVTGYEYRTPRGDVAVALPEEVLAVRSHTVVLRREVEAEHGTGFRPTPAPEIPGPEANVPTTAEVSDAHPVPPEERLPGVLPGMPEEAVPPDTDRGILKPILTGGPVELPGLGAPAGPISSPPVPPPSVPAPLSAKSGIEPESPLRVTAAGEFKGPSDAALPGPDAISDSSSPTANVPGLESVTASPAESSTPSGRGTDTVPGSGPAPAPPGALGPDILIFLVGKMVGEDIRDGDTILAQMGTVIDAALVDRVDRAGRLADLIVAMNWPDE